MEEEIAIVEGRSLEIAFRSCPLSRLGQLLL
jgi:hypothetical protein